MIKFGSTPEMDDELFEAVPLQEAYEMKMARGVKAISIPCSTDNNYIPDRFGGLIGTASEQYLESVKVKKEGNK